MFLKFLLLLACHVAAFFRRDNRVITSLKYSRFYVKPVVVNGLPASPGQVPYMVSIKEHAKEVKDKNTLWGCICGGSIIAPSRVLTAAHCFDFKDYSYRGNRMKLRAVAGDLNTMGHHDLNPESTATTQWRRISNIVRHQDYQFPAHDIALLFIDEPWYFSDYINPISPARANSDYLTWCIASGYGNMRHSKDARSSTRLLTAKLYILPRHECSKLWDMNMNEFVCTRSAYSDVAEGDSGGPLVCKGTVEKIRESAKGILVGIVSGKNFDKTTLFTRVSVYKDWIDKDSGFVLRSNVVLVAVTSFLL